MHIVIAGGTGFVGNKLAEHLLHENHSVALLSRSGKGAPQGTRVILWDARTPGLWTEHLEGADAVINLAGESIANRRWTARQKERIVNSRLAATRVLVSALAGMQKKPAVLINASAVGFYGDLPEGGVTESHQAGRGFLAETCAEWENEARKAEKAGLRVVLFRIGVVIGRGGGALAKMAPPFRCFIGGHLGSGRQWFPWIHIHDLCRAVLFILERREISGPVNLTAPQPLRMREFCCALGKAMGRPSWAPVPAFMLRLLAGEMAGMLLTGQCVIPKKLSDSGFSFRFPGAKEALKEVFQT